MRNNFLSEYSLWCAVILISPGRNYKLLPALAKNVPPARFLNASRPRAKRQRAPGFGGVFAAFAVSTNFQLSQQIAERILLMVRSRGDCQYRLRIMRLVMLRASRLMLPPRGVAGRLPISASHNATCYASRRPTYAPATRGRGATAVSLRVLVNIYFYVCHFNATGHLSSYKFTFL